MYKELDIYLEVIQHVEIIKESIMLLVNLTDAEAFDRTQPAAANPFHKILHARTKESRSSKNVLFSASLQKNVKVAITNLDQALPLLAVDAVYNVDILFAPLNIVIRIPLLQKLGI